MVNLNNLVLALVLALVSGGVVGLIGAVVVGPVCYFAAEAFGE